MKNFNLARITDLLETTVDNRGKTVPTATEGIPLIATNCIKEENLYPVFENVRYVDAKTHENWFRSHLKPNDILFVNKGTPGRVCLVPNPVNFCAAQDMIGLRPNPEKADSGYLFAYLRTPGLKKFVANNHVGLVIPHFRKQELKEIQIPLRSLPEQKAIGAFYVNICKKIELNKRINAELENLAKLVYDYWFVQFDFPMTAEQAAAHGDPTLTGKPYKSSGGKMTHNKSLNREIPEGWTDIELSKIATIIMGQSPPGSTYNSEGNGTLFFQGSTDFGDRFPSARQFTTQPTRLAITGDILLSVRAPVGTMNIAPFDCSIGRGLAALRSSSGHSTYLFQVMQYFQVIFERRNTSGTTFGSINKDDLHSLTFAHPTDQELVQNFHGQMKPLEEKTFNNHLQNQELAALRDWLLPMLMNGQVTVQS